MITASRAAPGVLLIAVEGTGRRNALDLTAFEALAAAWRDLEASADVRVGVVTGNGTDFCSGADLSSIASGIAAAVRAGRPASSVWGNIHRAVLRDVALTKPVVAAVEGICFGAGMEMVGASDIRIAGESARFALPEVRHGLIASGGSLARLARQIPYARAMHILLTGAEVSPAELASFGFLNEVVADGCALERALAVAGAIASNAPEAVRATKRAVTLGLGTDLPGAYAIEDEVSRGILTGAEAAEGARAFAEKRPPSWRLA